MDYYSSQISKLIEELSRLPGIGGKTAQRLAFYVLSLPENEAQDIDSLKDWEMAELKYRRFILEEK